MTTTTTRKLPNGDEVEIRTNAGAAPIVFINGVQQPRDQYKVVFGRDGLPHAIEKKLRNWRPWFAWRPVKTVSDRWVWWETIYRKVGNDYVDEEDFTWYWYGDEFDILKE